MNPIRSAWPDGFVQTNTDRCCACYSRLCTTSRSLIRPPSTAFRRVLPAGETRSPCACVNIRPFLYHQRIADADILRPTPSLRRRRHLTTMPRGFYICITLSTSDIGWQPPIFFPQRPSAVDTWWDDLLLTALGRWSPLLTPVVFVRVARRFWFRPCV
jgi:hypothetical protein